MRLERQSLSISLPNQSLRTMPRSAAQYSLGRERDLLMLNLMRSTITGVVLMMGAGLAPSATAQLPVHSLRLAVGFGVDTTASPEREILALWQHYLTTPSDSLRATLWSAQERLGGPHFDLVGPYVYQGFTHFTVVQLGPAVSLPQTFIIRTLVTAVD